MRISFVALLVSFLFFSLFASATHYYVQKSGDGTFFLQTGENANALAYGEYDKDMMTKGWNKLYITTNPKCKLILFLLSFFLFLRLKKN